MKTTKAPAKKKVRSTTMGRPQMALAKSLTDKFFRLITEGKSVREICRMDGMPCVYTIYKRIKDDKDFERAYRAAREMQAERFLDEIIQIADDGLNDTQIDPETGKTIMDLDHIARSRLRVDTRKWAMARMSPKKYGDKIQQELVGKGGGPIETVAATVVITDPAEAAKAYQKLMSDD